MRDLARDFADNEIRPKAAEYDEHQTHPADVIGKAVGYSGVTVVEVVVGDTPRIRRKAAINRVRETSRRVAGPQLFGIVAKLFRRKPKP